MRIGAVENPTTIALYGVFGIVFCAIGVFVLLGGSGLAGAVFAAFGALFLYGAVHSSLSRARYGDVALEVSDPVVPGGRLTARLDIPGGTGGATMIEAELRCKKVEWVRTAGKRSLSDSAIWSSKQSFPLRSAGKAAHCEIAFDLPADAPLSEGGSTATRTMPGIYWELQVATEDVEGVDLMRGFRFPVVAGIPAPSVILRPSVPPVTPSPQKMARVEEAKAQDNRASKAAALVAMAGFVALFAFMYLGQPTGRAMRQVFFAVIAAAMATYWVISYRNWLQARAENPSTPPLTGAFIWHMIVLAIAGSQLL
ncbi:MAG TPA: hypothetical protein VM140_00795 [Burkholderiales bacterium]|nr:hypothetical protein [Burkholderiales bacterium]